MRIFAAAPGSKEASPTRKGILRLIHFDDSFEKVAVGIDHRATRAYSVDSGSARCCV
jgi:hypothetical protein